MAGVVDLDSAESFREFLQNVGSGAAVIHFWADWAPQCAQITDVLVELANDQQLHSVKFAKIEAEKVPEVSHKYEITAVPTCVIIQNQSISYRVNGANVPDLVEKVRRSAEMGATATKPEPQPPSKEELNARIKKLINAAPIMLFMKGSPQEPKCGFSKTCIQLLNDQKATYSSFNILADNDVRQGLKEYSNWPTYPQLYINGELVGGLDIIKELIESGEFQTMLPSEQKLDDRLKSLVSRDKVMLFMKGNPDEPRCGFSRTTVDILKSTDVEFGHFDILQDEEVRQGLKKYSNWPTYPQLYVNGDLVGGLDIIKEIQESGELEETLRG